MTRKITRLLLTGAAVLLLGAAGTAVAMQEQQQDREPDEPERVQSTYRVVDPYERIEINDDAVMALLPAEKRQYVVTQPENTSRDHIDRNERDGLTGVQPDNRSVSAGSLLVNDRTVLVYGAYRLEGEPPTEIVITPEGEDWSYSAELVVLGGLVDWGTYYLDVTRYELPTNAFTVTAYDEDGEVFAETRSPVRDAATS